MCKCAEGFTNRINERGEHSLERTPTGLNMHNCQYVAWRDGFIPEAERMRDQTGMPFLACMDTLIERRRPFMEAALVLQVAHPLFGVVDADVVIEESALGLEDDAAMVEVADDSGVQKGDGGPGRLLVPQDQRGGQEIPTDDSGSGTPDI